MWCKCLPCHTSFTSCRVWLATEKDSSPNMEMWVMMTTRKGLNQVGDYALIQCFKSLSVCDFLIFFVNGKMPQESTRIVNRRCSSVVSMLHWWPSEKATKGLTPGWDRVKHWFVVFLVNVCAHSSVPVSPSWAQHTLRSLHVLNWDLTLRFVWKEKA